MTRECIRDFSTSAIPHHDHGVWAYSSRRLASIIIKAGSVAADRRVRPVAEAERLRLEPEAGSRENKLEW